MDILILQNIENSCENSSNIKIIIQFNSRILKVIKKKSQLQYSKISNFFTKINYKFP